MNVQSAQVSRNNACRANTNTESFLPIHCCVWESLVISVEFMHGSSPSGLVHVGTAG